LRKKEFEIGEERKKGVPHEADHDGRQGAPQKEKKVQMRKQGGFQWREKDTVNRQNQPDCVITTTRKRGT